jgi:mono/diheme cytochrome c family protein
MRLAGLVLSACALTLLAAPDVSAQDRTHNSGPTFTRDVAAIVFANCSTCHRPGESAPFGLLTYRDVRARGRLIAEAVRRRHMPPWKPVYGAEGGGPFAGERRLTDAQISTIERWVDLGMPEGDPAALPKVPARSDGWQVGTPDLIVTMPVPFTMPGEGPDVFRTFVIPVPVTTPKYVAAVEFAPGTSRALHHANVRFDRTPGSRDLDAADPLPGYEGPVSPGARYPDGYFLGWTPGQRPQRSPDGMAWRLEPGSDLVIQIHLKKTGRPESIQPRVGFIFTDRTPDRVPLAVRLGRQNIDLAPGARAIVHDSYRLPVDVQVMSIHPHAHYRATDVSAFATLPDGSRRPLIHIADWDFNWQDVYQFAAPVPLPRGTEIAMAFTYDNSAQNVRNPDRPPRRVLFGQNSTDEMGDLWLQVVTLTAQDRTRLVEDLLPKVLAEDVVGFDTLLKADSRNDSLRRAKAATDYNLATLLLAQRRWSEALSHLAAAVELRPEHGESHNNLGVALRALGRLDEAIEQFRRAVALDPSNAAARENLENALRK